MEIVAIKKRKQDSDNECNNYNKSKKEKNNEKK